MTLSVSRKRFNSTQAAAPRAAAHGFSLTPELVQDVLRRARPLGHYEDTAQLNLGFGFLYYGLARLLRPAHVVVIGSGFGFSVVCFALGLRDNGGGQLSFVDPSYSVLSDGPFKTVGGTSQWDDPREVERRFASFGVGEHVRHFRMRSAEFFGRYREHALPPIDLAFIDGSHAYDDVRQDFISSLKHAGANAYLLLHDTNIYIREMIRHAGVQRWLSTVRARKDLFELVDFPFSSGLAVVRALRQDAWKSLHCGSA